MRHNLKAAAVSALAIMAALAMSIPAYAKSDDKKIKEVKFEEENHTEIKQFKIDAQNITKAILKNAINKEVLFVGKTIKDLFK